MKDVTTLFNPLTAKVALFLLHLGMVVRQAPKMFLDQLIMLSYGLVIEGTTVKELTLTPGSLGGGCTHKQTINIGHTEAGRCLKQWVTILLLTCGRTCTPMGRTSH